MFYLFLLAHLVADFVLQPYWLVVRKQHWYGLLLHGGIVLLCMLLLPLLDPATLALWPLMLGITAVHIAADWWKVHYGRMVPGPSIVGFLLDQVIHVGTIALFLGPALPVEQVWAVSGSPVAQLALYAGAYIVAAFAVPIGVMVWLDPLFVHAARAARARLRSLCASAVVVSLTLFAGVLALPTILVGLAVALRYPASPHPLDTPTGMLTVITIATLLGAVLVILPA